MKTLVPQYWEERTSARPSSVFTTGPDRHYIALRSDLRADDKQGTINPYQDVYWPYAYLMLTRGLKHDLPLWLSNGVTGLMSNTIVNDSSIKIGLSIPWYFRQIHSGTRPTLAELVKIDRASAWYARGDQHAMFQALSWAFVHYLMFGDEGAHRAHFDNFVALLFDGKASSVAFASAFGSTDSLNSGFSAYLARPFWSFGRVNADIGVKPEAFPARQLTAAESGSLRAALHVVMDRPSDAHTLIESVRKEAVNLPAFYDTEGLLAERDRKPEDALAAYGKAISLDSTGFYTYYRWAALSRASAADAPSRVKIAQALARAVALNGTFASAHALLGEEQLLLGQRENALASVQRAVSLEPLHVGHRLSLVVVLGGIGRRDDAQREAAAAMALATTDEERGAVQRLIERLPPVNFALQSGPVFAVPPATGPIVDGSAGPDRRPSVAVGDVEGFGPQIYLDTKGVEFGPWMRRFVAQVKRNWSVPAAAMSLKGRVVTTFNVHKDGSITDLTVVGSSEVEAFNESAKVAVSSSNPTQPLPPGYPSEKALFTVTFFYNDTPLSDRDGGADTRTGIGGGAGLGQGPSAR
jgi:TonB family protein